MAGEVTQPATVDIISTDLIYRGIDPQYCQQGRLTSGVFVLKRRHTLQEGPSVGVARIIPLLSFHPLMGRGWGVGALEVSVPQSVALAVQSLPDPKWEEYALAHAVITDYEKLTDKGRNDVARFLRDSLQKNILISPGEQPSIAG
jgi:hypothetical protein